MNHLELRRYYIKLYHMHIIDDYCVFDIGIPVLHKSIGFYEVMKPPSFNLKQPVRWP